jgi:hypothetical protein
MKVSRHERDGAWAAPRNSSTEAQIATATIAARAGLIRIVVQHVKIPQDARGARQLFEKYE